MQCPGYNEQQLCIKASRRGVQYFRNSLFEERYRRPKVEEALAHDVGSQQCVKIISMSLHYQP